MDPDSLKYMTRKQKTGQKSNLDVGCGRKRSH